MILDETYKLIKNKYGENINNIVISDIAVGVFLTAVLLSDGSAGTASTNLTDQSNCYINNRYFGDFSPSKIKGQKIVDLFENDYDLRISNSLKVAILNAIFSKLISDSEYKIIKQTDPIDLLDLEGSKTITIVGAFQSYIKKISKTNNELNILELDENALTEDQKQFYVPAADYKNVLPNSDIVIITGLTIVNNTIDDLVAYTHSKSKVVVTGPSSSLIPDVLFNNNVDVVGSTLITNPGLMFSVVEQAGTGFHLFKYCAEKFCIVNE